MISKKRIYIIAGVFLVLVISSYIYGLVSLRVGERDFALPKDSEVVLVQITPFEGEKIVLQKGDHGRWWVDSEHSANEFAVRDLIRTVRHFSVRQPVSVASQQKLNERLDNEGVRVSVHIEGYMFDFFNLFGLYKTHRLYNSFMVGENTTDIVGTYMRKANSETPYIVYLPGYSEGLSEVFAPEKHIWYDPVVVDLKAEEIKQVKVIANEKPDESFIIKLDEKLNFLFYDLENNMISDKISPDNTRVYRFLSSFKGLYYETLLLGNAFEESEKLIFPDYAFRIVVEDINDNQYGFNVYRRYRLAGISEPAEASHVFDPDRFYLELETGQRALAQYFVFGRTLRPLSFFEVDR